MARDNNRRGPHTSIARAFELITHPPDETERAELVALVETHPSILAEAHSALNNTTPLHIAARHADRTAFFQLVQLAAIHNMAALSQADGSGNTALYYMFEFIGAIPEEATATIQFIRSTFESKTESTDHCKAVFSSANDIDIEASLMIIRRAFELVMFNPAEGTEELIALVRSTPCILDARFNLFRNKSILHIAEGHPNKTLFLQLLELAAELNPTVLVCADSLGNIPICSALEIMHDMTHDAQAMHTFKTACIAIAKNPELSHQVFSSHADAHVTFLRFFLNRYQNQDSLPHDAESQLGEVALLLLKTNGLISLDHIIQLSTDPNPFTTRINPLVLLLIDQEPVRLITEFTPNKELEGAEQCAATLLQVIDRQRHISNGLILSILTSVFKFVFPYRRRSLGFFVGQLKLGTHYPQVLVDNKSLVSLAMEAGSVKSVNALLENEKYECSANATQIGEIPPIHVLVSLAGQPEYCANECGILIELFQSLTWQHDTNNPRYLDLTVCHNGRSALWDAFYCYRSHSSIEGTPLGFIKGCENLLIKMLQHNNRQSRYMCAKQDDGDNLLHQCIKSLMEPKFILTVALLNVVDLTETNDQGLNCLELLDAAIELLEFAKEEESDTDIDATTDGEESDSDIDSWAEESDTDSEDTVEEIESDDSIARYEALKEQLALLMRLARPRPTGSRPNSALGLFAERREADVPPDRAHQRRHSFS